MRLAERFGEAVRRERERQQATQEQLGELAGVSGRQIRKIEAGHANPTLDTVEAIAGALGVDALVLLAG